MDISGNNLILASNNGSLITVHDIPTALSNGNLNTTSLTINTTVSYFQTLIAGGNYLALGRTSDVNKSIFVYDLTTGTLLHTLPAPVGASAAFGDAIDIKGNYLVAGHRGQEQYSPTAVYDLTTGILLQTFTGDDIPDTSTWQNPDVDKLLGTAVAITDSKTIIGSGSGGESANNWLGAFLIYSNPSQSAPAEESTGWTIDLSNVTYDSVSFGVNQDNEPMSIAFNNDGTKMYMMGSFHKNIHQYTLSTGFDLSTASYDNVFFYVGSQDNSPMRLKFNTDGTKMYINGFQRNKVHQYSLGSGFDLSTASYDNVAFEIPEWNYGFTFNNDGTKMYSSSNALRQYSLSAGFDISTATYDNVNFDLSSQSHSAVDTYFNSDGTKMYILFAGGEDDVHQYTLTTGFDISTASYDNVMFSVGGEETNPTAICISSDGTKMYSVGTSNDTVYQYSTGL
jgi:sugar lactone lactonase YvrE